MEDPSFSAPYAQTRSPILCHPVSPRPNVFTAGPAPTVTTSYSITSRSGAASSGAAEAEKHRARGARVLPHAVALLPVLLLLLVALAVVCGWVGERRVS